METADVLPFTDTQPGAFTEFEEWTRRGPDGYSPMVHEIARVFREFAADPSRWSRWADQWQRGEYALSPSVWLQPPVEWRELIISAVRKEALNHPPDRTPGVRVLTEEVIQLIRPEMYAPFRLGRAKRLTFTSMGHTVKMRVLIDYRGESAFLPMTESGDGEAFVVIDGTVTVQLPDIASEVPSAEFWNTAERAFYEALKPHPRKREQPSAPPPKAITLSNNEQYFQTFNNQTVIRTQDAFKRPWQTGDPDSFPWPLYQLGGAAFKQGDGTLLTLQPRGSDYPYTQQGALVKQMGEYLRARDTYVADVFYSILTILRENPNKKVRIEFKTLAQMLDLKPRKNTDGRLASYDRDMGRRTTMAIMILASLSIRGTVKETSNRVEIESSPWFHFENFRYGYWKESEQLPLRNLEIAGIPVIADYVKEFTVSLSGKLDTILFDPGNPCIALLNVKTLHRGPRDPEKLLGYYIQQAWRIRATDGIDRQPFDVGSLLDKARINFDQHDPQRAKDALENASDGLAAKNIIGNRKPDGQPDGEAWFYRGWDDTQPLKRGWWKEWLKASIVYVAPDPVRNHYRNGFKTLASRPTPKLLPAPADLHTQLRTWRKAQPGRPSQADIAERLGITQAYLSLIESGKLKPTTALVKAITSMIEAPSGPEL